jgi:uncharacterized membrane protein YgdD (TMEM256/DUF423 family)
MEKKNILTGSLLIAAFLLMGAYLETQLGSGLEWKTSARHAFWKSAHVHGLGFGILNILYGFLLKNYCKQNNVILAGSFLAILGALLPIALFLAGIQKDLKVIAPVGGISMVSAWFVMVYSIFVNMKK